MSTLGIQDNLNQALHILSTLARQKYLANEYDEACKIIDPILQKTQLLEREHFLLLKTKGLCQIAQADKSIGLNNHAAVNAALKTFLIVQKWCPRDFEVQKGIALCYYNLSRSSQEAVIIARHALEKAHALNPWDLEIVRDWVSLESERGNYQSALTIIEKIEDLLPRCKQKDVIVPLLTDRISCCFALKGMNAVAQTSYKMLEKVLGTTDLLKIKATYKAVLD